MCNDASVPTTSLPPDVLLSVLAEPTRAAIIRALAEQELCTCHLVELTGQRQTNISNHLRALREAGVVDSQAAGRFTYYRLVPEVLEVASGTLARLAATARAGSGRRAACD
jgi:ArsR family transcriptional regulator